MIDITFENHCIKLFGGRCLNFNGKVTISAHSHSLLKGKSGSGKSTLLAVISCIYNHMVPPIHSVPKSGVRSTGADKIKYIGFIHQNPPDNFHGGPISDHLRVSLAATRVPLEDALKVLPTLLSETFGMDPSFINRDPMTLSSGQQQILAAAIQGILKPDLLLLDEPFSRLSIENATRLLKFLKKELFGSYCIITSHDSKEIYSPENIPEHTFKLTRSHDAIEIEEAPAEHNGIDATNNLTSTADLFIDTHSYLSEKDFSNNFSNLPESNIRCIRGSFSNSSCVLKEFQILNSDTVLSHGDMSIHDGINIIYGENGAGKTLVARVFAGEIFNYSSFFKKILKNSLSFKAKESFFKIGNKEISFRKLAKSRRCSFMPSDPSLRIGGLTVSNTLEVADKESKLIAQEILGEYGVSEDTSVDKISYGLQKILSFCILPSQANLIILDEPFTNIPSQLQKIIATQILDRVDRRDWQCVLITSNRPLSTLKTLALGKGSE